MNLKSIFKDFQNIAGVDEVGRGSLIGPVYASAVILKKNCDVSIHINAMNYGISEDAHHILMHVMLQYLIQLFKTKRD